MTASTRDGRLLCAAGCAYQIAPDGSYTPLEPYQSGAGWTGQPEPVSGGAFGIDAALVGATVDGIVVAFRGTEETSLLDWLQDLDVLLTSEPHVPGKVAGNFWAAVDAVWAGVMEKVAALLAVDPEATVLFTGHSKGGPMATLAAARAAFQSSAGPQADAVVTFASPYPGNAEFTQGFPADVPVTRYENYLDTVPLLPPGPEYATALDVVLASTSLDPSIRAAVTALLALSAVGDFQPLGDLQYIQADHDIVGDASFTFRVFELCEAMRAGDWASIAAAHSHACGAGYMRGVCPDVPCLTTPPTS